MRYLRPITTSSLAALCVGAFGIATLAWNAPRAALAEGARASCSPRATIVSSPRRKSLEVQVKAINDRGDIVGFADSDGGSGPAHAILWKGGGVASAVDLGLLPGYVASEAYGVNGRRAVFGLLYDAKERAVPFRWERGRMTVLKGPNGGPLYTEKQGDGGRKAINERGEIAWTVIVGGNRRAVRWTRDGKASFLPGLPGHAWTNAFSINDAGIVSGWSRKLPSDDGEENPVLWTRSGKVIPLRTVPGRADGIAEATNGSGLTVGYLGTLGTDTDPESDQAVAWRSRTGEPLLLGPARPNLIAELVDVNEHSQAVGMTGTLNPDTGFKLSKPVVWRTRWSSLHPLPIPAASRANPVLVTSLNDVNNRGAVVGNVFGLAAKDYSALRRIDPVLWTCAFGS